LENCDTLADFKKKNGGLALGVQQTTAAKREAHKIQVNLPTFGSVL
jgi:hypothetical protein